MDTGTRRWRRSAIRSSMQQYREALENYYVKNKRVVEVADGAKAFSLLSPALGSAAARRRIRCIIRNIVSNNTVVTDDGAVSWGSRTPHFVTVAVTYACQCDCAHCSADGYRRTVARNATALTIAELRDAIQQAIGIGSTCVILTGGEPLLLDGICDLIGSVDPAKAVCTVFTNGEYLIPATVQRLRLAGLFGVFVSLDSSDGALHDGNRRRPGLFRKALEGIRRCQDAGLLTGLASYITREKMRDGELDAFMGLARELNVLEVFLFDVIATGKLREDRACMLSAAEVEEVAALRKRYNETHDYPRIIHQTMFTSIAYPCAAEGCPAGVAQIHLRGNGDVAPCDFTPYSFGNIRRESLADIWRRITEHRIYSGGSHRCRLADPRYWDELAAAATPA